MSQLEDDLEVISDNGTNSDDWVISAIGNGETSSPETRGAHELNNNLKIARDVSIAVVQNSHKNDFQLTADQLVNLLSVRNKPDPLADWDNLYNLPQQKFLRRDCSQLIQKIGNLSSWTVPQVESLMTLYCKRRNVGYDSEQCWMEILGKLLLLPFDHCALFNVFWSITTKYVPKSTKMFDLYRLLLQYHDPKLCSYLDSFRIPPEQFTRDWFCALLSKDMSAELCWTIWHRYFEKGDPFLIFFIALAFTQGVREEIFKLNDRKEIVASLKEQPHRMAKEDVHDLLEICCVHLNLTPISIREDFHCMLFGSNFVDEFSEVPLNRLICLPISAQEVCRRAIDVTTPTTATFGYFIIDTRSQKNFNAGCISGSYNLNAETIVEDPQKFGFAMDSLMKFKEDNYPSDHICFLGSGAEEGDQFMNMVIAKFLKMNYEHISYAEGGYRALHQVLNDSGHLNKLSNHYKRTDCTECKMDRKEVKPSTGLSLLERLKKSIPTKMDLKIKSAKQQKTVIVNENVKHVNSTERFGKRYRNVKSVFSINNDDSQSSDVDDLHNVVEGDPEMRTKEKLRWTSVVKKAEIAEHFEGEEVLTPDNEHVPCYIGLTRTHMHIFHKVDKEPNMVHPSLRHSLSSIMRVTSKRRFPEFLTFKFGYELPTGESHINRVHYFILPKAGDCAKAVKLAIIALKPPTVNDDETLSES